MNPRARRRCVATRDDARITGTNSLAKTPIARICTHFRFVVAFLSKLLRRAVLSSLHRIGHSFCFVKKVTLFLVYLLSVSLMISPQFLLRPWL
jgi:hypothetical protein